MKEDIDEDVLMWEGDNVVHLQNSTKSSAQKDNIKTHDPPKPTHSCRRGIVSDEPLCIDQDNPQKAKQN